VKLLVVSGQEDLRRGIHDGAARRLPEVQVLKASNLYAARVALAKPPAQHPDIIVLDACAPVNPDGRQYDYVYTSQGFLVDVRQRNWPPTLVVCERDRHFDFVCELEATSGRIYATRRTRADDIVLRAIRIAADILPQ
jgi:hypothetical protein